MRRARAEVRSGPRGLLLSASRSPDAQTRLRARALFALDPKNMDIDYRFE